MLRTSLTLLLAIGLAGCAGQAAQTEETTPESAAPAETAPAEEEPAAAAPCSEDEEDVAPGAMATVAQSDRVWAFVRGYIADNSGELAGTYDLPGDEHGLARLQSFRTVTRTEGGFATAAEFVDADHTYEVRFELDGQCDLEVTSVELASVDGAALGDAIASSR